MREKVYVDRLFADYEDTTEIRDFKEEIAGNLRERVRELMSKGLSEDEAFEKAAAELGDITAIADDLGKKKRNDMIGQMYIGTKVPVSMRTAMGQTIATGLLMLALGLGMIVYFGGVGGVLYYYIAAALLSVAIGMYVFIGLTQETASHYTMKDGRALAYWAAVTGTIFGACLACVLFFFDNYEISLALGVEGLFLIPSVCALVFLRATESDRLKPWAKAMSEQWASWGSGFHTVDVVIDPAKAARFGVASGGLWLFAVAAMIALFFVIGWLSLLVFIIAVGIQIIMAGTLFKNVASG
jgi:MFS family permease